MEIWKDIKGYAGYQVSNYGRVRTHNKITHTDKHGDRHWKDRIMKQKKTKFNALRVDLWSDNEHHQTLCVHRLVALAFLGEPPEADMTVNHIDGNRLNNTVDNLEWLSLADNIRHGYKTGLYASVMKPITLIDDCGNEFNFVSMAEANRFLGRCDSYLQTAIKKGHKIHNKNNTRYHIKPL